MSIRVSLTHRNRQRERAIVAFNALVLRGPASGVEKSVVELARALDTRAAFDYRLFAPYGDTSLPAAARRVAIPAWCRGRAARILYELTLMPRALRRVGADLLHATAYVAPPRAPCPIVLSVYDLHVYTHAALCRTANRLHYRWRLPGSIRRAAAIIVPSQHTRTALLDRFPDAARKTRVVPLGVAARFLSPVTPARLAEVRHRYVLPDTYLLFVGTPAPRKNLPGLFAAWAQLHARHPSLRLLLVGAPGGDPAAHHPPSGVTRLDYVPEADLPGLYALARVLVHPSFDEGFGLPVLEAMAAGCPVVCAGEAPAEFAAGAATFCAPLDAVGLADHVTSLLPESAARAGVIANGRRLATRYTWNATAAAVEAIYRQVLDESPVAPLNQ